MRSASYSRTTDTSIRTTAPWRISEVAGDALKQQVFGKLI